MTISLTPYIQIVSISLTLLFLIIGFVFFTKAIKSQSEKEEVINYAKGWFFSFLAICEFIIFMHIQAPWFGLFSLIPLIGVVIFYRKIK